MSDHSTSVPQVARRKHVLPTRYVVTSRYRYQFPPPDDEHFEVDQMAFAAIYFLCVFMLFIATAFFAAFVLVPVVGRLLAG